MNLIPKVGDTIRILYESHRELGIEPRMITKIVSLGNNYPDGSYTIGFVCNYPGESFDHIRNGTTPNFIYKPGRDFEIISRTPKNFKGISPRSNV